MPEIVMQERIEKGKMLSRQMRIEVPEDAEERTVDVVFSTEESEVERYFGLEVLGHGKGEVNMSRLASGSAALLVDHNWQDQIGVITSARIEGKKGRATVRFGKSARAEEIYQDVKDGIRKNISVGYFVNRLLLVEAGSEGVPSKYRAVDWEPYEISIVSIPADMQAGIGRDAEASRPITFIEPQQHQQRGLTMEPHNQNAHALPDNASGERAPAQSTQVAVNEALAAERKRTQSIHDIANAHARNLADIDKIAQRFISEGRSVADFTQTVLDSIARSDNNAVRFADNNPKIGLNEQEARSFSVVRALEAAMDQDWSRAGFELEVMKATRDKYKDKRFKGNIQIPMDVLMVKRHAAKRDMETGTAGQGAELVATMHDAANFIDLLRNQMLIPRLGGRILSGLVGNLSIPKQTGGATSYWIVEGESVPQSDLATGSVALTPHTVASKIKYSRRMIQQSSPDIENMVRQDIAESLGLSIDAAVFDGSGNSGEPTGIINISGVGAGTFTTVPQWGDIVDQETRVATQNALNNTMHYVTTPTLRGAMKQTEKAAGTAQFIWNNMPGMPGIGDLNGYMAHASNQIPADTQIFGNFNDLLIGEWGVLDMLVNPYSDDDDGGVKVIGMQDVDIAVRHAQSFDVLTKSA